MIKLNNNADCTGTTLKVRQFIANYDALAKHLGEPIETGEGYQWTFEVTMEDDTYITTLYSDLLYYPEVPLQERSKWTIGGKCIIAAMELRDYLWDLVYNS